MSHNLNFTNGRASMMYVGEVPWHSLGTKLNKPATAAEAMVEAQMDFVVKKAANVHRFPDGREIVSESSFFTYREDTGAVLGSRLGPSYTVLQQKDAFGFFDEIVGAGEAIYHTAGVLGRGERVWLLAKLPDYIRVRVNGKDDPVEKFLLLANGHDGSLAVKGKLTPIRVVCNNTLQTALNLDVFGRAHDDSADTVSIRHGHDVKERTRKAGVSLGLYNQLYEQLEGAFNVMALKQITGDELLKYVQTLMPAEREDKEDSKWALMQQEKVMDLHESGAGSEMARGTVWGAYNAVTEFTDHVVWNAGKTGALLKSLWFGGSREKLKERAFELAVKMANN